LKATFIFVTPITEGPTRISHILCMNGKLTDSGRCVNIALV